MFYRRGSFPVSTQTYLLASSITSYHFPPFCPKLRESRALAENSHSFSRSRLSSVGIQSHLSTLPHFCLCQKWQPAPLLILYHKWPPVGGSGAAGPVRAPSQPDHFCPFFWPPDIKKMNSWWLLESVLAYFLFFLISLTRTPSLI